MKVKKVSKIKAKAIKKINQSSKKRLVVKVKPIKKVVKKTKITKKITVKPKKVTKKIVVPKNTLKKRIVAPEKQPKKKITPKIKAKVNKIVTPSVVSESPKVIDNPSIPTLNLEDFLLDTNNLGNNLTPSNPIFVDEKYDLETAILEYSDKNHSSIVETEPVVEVKPVINQQPTINITDNNIRSAYLINLSESKITKQEIAEKINHIKTPVFQQPKRSVAIEPIKTKISNLFKPKSTVKAGSYLPSSVKLHMALQFTAIVLLLILPLRVLHVYNALGETKNKVMGVTELGVDGMKNAATALSNSSWETAIVDFNQASEQFANASAMLQQINTTSLLLADKIPVLSKSFTSAHSLLEAGNLSAQSAVQITEIIKQLNTENKDDLGVKLITIKEGLAKTKGNFEKINQLLKEVDVKTVPENYQAQMQLVLNNLPLLEETYNNLDSFITFTEKVLGFDSEKRYIFIFQNNNELRATGGFMGSFALVDIKDGKIKKTEVPGGGFYDLKSSFFQKIIAPAPLNLVGIPWGVWDGNWWPDFSLSAKKMQWFLEKSRWPTVDGVFAFNSSLVTKLIKITGDIDMPQYNKKLNSDNIVLALQHAVEFEYDKVENKPKQIIGDLMPIFVDRLFAVSDKQSLPLLLTLHQSLKEKEIQMYFNDSELQSYADNQGWSGVQKKVDSDYLMIVNSNIAGGKTDNVVNQTETVYSYPQEDGSVVHTVSITRTHNGSTTDVFERINNVSYIRVYAPAGSQFLEVTGQDKPEAKYFKEALPGYKADEDLKQIETNKTVDQASGTDIYQENERQVFGNWLQVEPGESKTITFSYRVPSINKNMSWFDKILTKLSLNFDNYQTYNLYWQKQSGKNSTFEHQLVLPSGKKFIWNDSSNQNQQVSDNKLITSGVFNVDLLIVAIFDKS